MNENHVEQKSLTIIDQARAVRVFNAQSYTLAGEMWKQIRDMMKEVASTFDPIITAAHAAHKKALEKKAQYYTPLEQAQKSVKQLMSRYDEEQARIAREEAARLAEIARKAEEERLLQEAIMAEEAGEKEEAAAILQEEVYVAPITIAKATPKLNGGPIYREITKFEIINEFLIPRQYLCVDMVKLGGVVRALKGAANIPGIRVYSERC